MLDLAPLHNFPTKLEEILIKTEKSKMTGNITSAILDMKLSDT